MTITDIALILAVLYLALVFIKFCLMLGTFPCAIGTYYRKGEGRMSKTNIFLLLLSINVFVCTFGIIRALRNEGFGFFGVYSNFSTMRQICQNFRG